MPHLIQIGNSRGIHIPKSLIQQAGLESKELECAAVEEGLLIKPARPRARQGWEKQIREAVKAHGGEIVDREWLDVPLIDEELNG